LKGGILPWGLSPAYGMGSCVKRFAQERLVTKGISRIYGVLVSKGFAPSFLNVFHRNKLWVKNPLKIRPEKEC